MSDQIHNYTELQELFRISLRIQNPEWVEPNGDSPICANYEARLATLLANLSTKDHDRGANGQFW